MGSGVMGIGECRVRGKLNPNELTVHEEATWEHL